MSLSTRSRSLVRNHFFRHSSEFWYSSNAFPKTANVSDSQIPPPHPSEVKTDLIGPPNKISNLRPILFHVPKNETQLERTFRLEREKVQQWNEDFWIKHNSAFLKESNVFRQEKLKSSSPEEKSSVSAEEMSEFYKAFLDKHWKTHLSYNFEWYGKNFHLLYLALKVQLSKLGLVRK